MITSESSNFNCTQRKRSIYRIHGISCRFGTMVHESFDELFKAMRIPIPAAFACLKLKSADFGTIHHPSGTCLQFTKGLDIVEMGEQLAQLIH